MHLVYSIKIHPPPKLAAKRSANFLQIHFRFTSDSLQIFFRFTSDSLQIHFRFTLDLIHFRSLYTHSRRHEFPNLLI
ncbi:hypothetical protein ACN38_g11013 [Penicillium nordicum]|uniref:Uncharacterized protein n=1 Tax=Penicillium nordicum TaxID=229535 RepID=A0A0M9WBH6_9EURO|nr:hypothetical protein ACN38_g11013 [Penicillium nordicum]